MDFKQIEAFVNVVKYKNFSRAADASFLTQPTVSAHINNLEKELNAVLLNRQGREITMTKQGELFYPHAVNMMNIREQAMMAVRGLNRQIEGVLEIQASSIPGQYYVPGLLGEFRKQFPAVKIFIEQSDSRNVIENIALQKGEIGFTGAKLSSNLVYEPIFQDEMMLIAPNKGKFGEVQGDYVTTEMLQGEDFIMREDGSATKKEFEKAIANGVPLMKNINVVAHMNSMEAIKGAVAGGLGISVVSNCVAKQINPHDGLRCFKIKGMEHVRTFYMVRSKNCCLSPAAEKFWAYVLQRKAEKAYFDDL